MKNLIQGYLMVLVFLVIPVLSYFGESLAVYIAIVNAVFCLIQLQYEVIRIKKVQSRRQASSTLQ